MIYIIYTKRYSVFGKDIASIATWTVSICITPWTYQYDIDWNAYTNKHSICFQGKPHRTGRYSRTGKKTLAISRAMRSCKRRARVQHHRPKTRRHVLVDNRMRLDDDNIIEDDTHKHLSTSTSCPPPLGVHHHQVHQPLRRTARLERRVQSPPQPPQPPLLLLRCPAGCPDRRRDDRRHYTNIRGPFFLSCGWPTRTRSLVSSWCGELPFSYILPPILNPPF